MECGKHNRYSPWRIEAAVTQQNEVFNQSIFFQGNGRFGLRAVLPGDAYTSKNHGVYKAGGFEYIKDNITDMVNLPDPLRMDIFIDSVLLSSAGSIQTLDMKCALVTRRWFTEAFSCSYERVVSFSNKDMAGHRFTFTAKRKLALQVRDVIDMEVMNLPVNDDQTIQNQESLVLLRDCSSKWENGNLAVMGTTIHAGCPFAYTKYVACSLEGKEEGACIRYETNMEAGQQFSCEALVSLEGLDREHYDFARLLSETERDLSLFWNEHDIELKGPVQDQCAIRWNLFMLKQNEPEMGHSIGARGLTHGRYKGCYFWDTEIFILPYYLYTNPSIAKNILFYRVQMFDQAKAYAASLNLRGARFPWMSALDGTEQCESWDTGKCEVHVTADITWAMNQYVQAVGDHGIERENFCEIYLETARFWASRFTYLPNNDRYEMLFVKGPNEYGGVTKNNTYTTSMALHSIKLALAAAERGDVSISSSERTEFEAICAKAVIPYSKEERTYLEDDLFMFMEDFDLKAHKRGGRPLYHTLCFDRLQRYKVIKQPDILLLYLLLPDLFTKDEALKAWLLYEPLTSHDSTLSWGMHALIAYKLGLVKDAEQYLYKAMFLDLEELMENTSGEGLHIGAMGAFLQSLLFGVTGLQFENGISVSPSLPDSWEKLACKASYKGERYQVVCTKKGGYLAKISLTNG